MKILDALSKSVLLLFRESNNDDDESFLDSRNLVSEVVSQMEILEANENLPGTQEGVLVNLMEVVRDLLVEEHDPIGADGLKDTIKIACKDHDKVANVLIDGIDREYDDSGLQRAIMDLKRSLTNFIKEKKISKLLRTANFAFSRSRTTIKDTNGFIRDLIAELEALELRSTNKGIKASSEVDLNDPEALEKVLGEIKDQSEHNGIMKTGYLGIDEMAQGGLRRGEFICHSALQHNYKTGINLGMFTTVPLFNKPYLFNEKKKPLLVRISFEDDLTQNIEYMYTLLKFMETKEYVSTKNASVAEMSAFIKDHMSVNGFTIKMFRANPNDWTYMDIFKTIVDLEAMGYEIHLLSLDYLGLVSTAGCTQGPAGVDIRNLFNRVRNFCAAKKITTMTPHQVAPDAKALLRNGLPDDQFVNEIANRGYYSGSKQLDQEIDLEFYHHISLRGDDAYLTIRRGKHRLPTVISETEKYCVYKFPDKMPIPPDINDEKAAFMRKVPSRSGVTDLEDLF